MKKILVVVVAVGMIMSFQSCKKDYTCKCTVATGSVNIEYTKVKKADAEESCDAAENTYKIADPNASCTLE